eukprot:379466_1
MNMQEERCQTPVPTEGPSMDAATKNRVPSPPPPPVAKRQMITPLSLMDGNLPLLPNRHSFQDRPTSRPTSPKSVLSVENDKSFRPIRVPRRVKALKPRRRHFKSTIGCMLPPPPLWSPED